MSTPRLLAVSDLHLGVVGNDDVLDLLQPTTDGDWLILAGDITEDKDLLAHCFDVLGERFDQLVWVPGNHELYHRQDSLRGPARYASMVDIARAHQVLTPEDPYVLFPHHPTPIRVVPLFIPYDYSWRPAGMTIDEAMEAALSKGIMATDELAIDTAPFASMVDWTRARLAATVRRLALLPADEDTILINHWPLTHEPVTWLRHREFELWCGTRHTAQWARRYRAHTVVYGHLHIPRSHTEGGTYYEECSSGYPRERRERGFPVPLARQILPACPEPQVDYSIIGGRIARTGTTGWERLGD